MTKYNIGDVELYVEEQGRGAPLFFIAGLGGRGEFWRKQVGPFSEHFRVILHDHRGVGNSTPDKVVFGAEHMADDLLKLMDVMGIEKANLVGHSTGGAICQHIALKAPDRIEKLVLSCSWAGPDPYFQHLFHTRRQVLISCGPEAYLTTGTYLAMPSSVLQPQMKSGRDMLNDRMKAFPGLEVELSRLSAVMSHDLRSLVHNIPHRPLCIGAKDDQITPAGFTRELADLIPDSTLHLLEHGGHFCPIAFTEDYNAAVLNYLRNE